METLKSLKTDIQFNLKFNDQSENSIQDNSIVIKKFSKLSKFTENLHKPLQPSADHHLAHHLNFVNQKSSRGTSTDRNRFNHVERSLYTSVTRHKKSSFHHTHNFSSAAATNLRPKRNPEKKLLGKIARRVLQSGQFSVV